MTIQVNGEPAELPDVTTVAQLLERLELPRDGVAVAVNAHVVPKTTHATHRLSEGDRVEIVRAVGGG